MSGNVFGIVGGDLRNVALAKSLADDKNKVFIYGLDKVTSKKEFEKINIKVCDSLEECITDSNIIIGPIPFTRDGKTLNGPFNSLEINIEDFSSWLDNKLLFAGSIPDGFYELVTKQQVLITDLMKVEELAILNIIATTEGAISQMIENTDINIQGSNTLILGFGRIGKLLSKKLQVLGVNVTCAARKSQDLTWIEAYGYDAKNIYSLKEDLNKYDVIVNTVPHLILDKEKLQYVKNDCLLLELASRPGGFDLDYINKSNLKYVPALGLPGKVAYKTSAVYIKNIIYKLLKIN